MTDVSRYIIVLDRFDDDDYASTEFAPDGHNGSAQSACEQVAAELQEAMTEYGTPAGFFRVIERRKVNYDQAVTSDLNNEEIAQSLGIDRQMENDYDLTGGR